MTATESGIPETRRSAAAMLDQGRRAGEGTPPFLPWEAERAFLLLDIGQYPKAALRIGTGEWVGDCGHTSLLWLFRSGLSVANNLLCVGHKRF